MQFTRAFTRVDVDADIDFDKEGSGFLKIILLFLFAWVPLQVNFLKIGAFPEKGLVFLLHYFLNQ